MKGERCDPLVFPLEHLFSSLFYLCCPVTPRGYLIITVIQPWCLFCCCKWKCSSYSFAFTITASSGSNLTWFLSLLKEDRQALSFFDHVPPCSQEQVSSVWYITNQTWIVFLHMEILIWYKASASLKTRRTMWWTFEKTILMSSVFILAWFRFTGSGNVIVFH